MPKANKTMIFATIICVLVTGIVRRFLNVSLSRSMKKSIAAITPITQGRRKITPYPITILNNPSKSCALSAYLAKLLGVIIIKVIGIGNKNADRMTSGINFFRFNFQNSHFISSSNPLTPCHPLKIVLKTFFAGMGFRYFQAVFYKSGNNPAY